jgi:hypothetical protein
LTLLHFNVHIFTEKAIAFTFAQSIAKSTFDFQLPAEH